MEGVSTGSVGGHEGCTFMADESLEREGWERTLAEERKLRSEVDVERVVE